MSKVTLFGRTIDEINAYNDEFRKKGAEMSTKEIELSLVAITAREERDKLRKENADLKAKLDAAEQTLKATEDAYHKLRIKAYTLRPQLEACEKESATRYAVIKNDCETEERVKQIALKHLSKEQVEGDSMGVPNSEELCQWLSDKITELETKLEAALQVQFDAAAFEKVVKERDDLGESHRAVVTDLVDLQAKLDAAEACCAEIREALLMFREASRLGWLQDSRIEPALNTLALALSSSCGQGFVRASELDKPINALRDIKLYVLSTCEKNITRLLAHVVRLCIDAGVKEHMDELQTLRKEAE